jgi:hypothetical protein
MNLLKGWRTYLIAGFVALITGLAANGNISQSTASTILGIATALGLTTARAGASADLAAHADDPTAHK